MVPTPHLGFSLEFQHLLEFYVGWAGELGRVKYIHTIVWETFMVLMHQRRVEVDCVGLRREYNFLIYCIYIELRVNKLVLYERVCSGNILNYYYKKFHYHLICFTTKRSAKKK